MASTSTTPARAWPPASSSSACATTSNPSAELQVLLVVEGHAPAAAPACHVPVELRGDLLVRRSLLAAAVRQHLARAAVLQAVPAPAAVERLRDAATAGTAHAADLEVRDVRRAELLARAQRQPAGRRRRRAGRRHEQHGGDGEARERDQAERCGHADGPSRRRAATYIRQPPAIAGRMTSTSV